MAVAPPPRVLIADGDDLTRAKIRDAVEHGGFIVVAEVADAYAAIREARQSRPDVVLLDVRMAGGGLHAAEVIGFGQGHVSVVMLTDSTDDEDFFTALSVGASGFLLKGQDLAEIPTALHRVLAGEAVIDGLLAKRLVEEFRADGTAQQTGRRLLNGARLTPKERDVLTLLVDGLQTKEMAEKLRVADVTVRTHLSNICQKLGATNRAEVLELVRASERGGRAGDDQGGVDDDAGYLEGGSVVVAGDSDDVSLDQVLQDLSWIAESRTQSERQLAEWVQMARSLGASWTRIGDALGMTRQSAWQRFSGEG